MKNVNSLSVPDWHPGSAAGGLQEPPDIIKWVFGWSLYKIYIDSDIFKNFHEDPITGVPKNYRLR